MNPVDYATDIKNRFGDSLTGDGRFIRELDDRELIQRMITKYPSERYKIVGVDEFLTPEQQDLVPPESKEDKKIDQFQQRVGNITNAFNERFANQQRALGRSMEGEQSIGSGFLQAVGEGAGFIGDVGFEALKASTPDAVKEPIKQFLGGTAQVVSETEPAKALGEMWSGLDEETRENLEAVGGIATSIPGVGVAGKVGQKGVKVAAEAAEKATEVAESAGQAVASKIDETLQSRAMKEGAKREEKAYQDTIDITAPVLGKKDSISAFKRAGEEGGVTEQGMLGKYKVAPDARAKEIADDTFGLVSSKKGPIDNIANVNRRIADIAEVEVRPFLRESGTTYNPLQLQTYLKQLPKPLSLKANPETYRAYNSVIETAMQIANQFPKTSEGLWDARKAIDDMIEREFGDAAFDSASGIGARRAALAIRSGINDFISEGLGGGDLDLVNRVNDFIREARKRGIEIKDPAQVKKQAAQISGIADVPDEELLKAFWKAKLREMNNLYIAQENMAEQAWRLLGKNGFERWMKANPGKASIAKQALLLGGLGTAGAVGATILSN